jgi:hypothetical protein
LHVSLGRQDKQILTLGVGLVLFLLFAAAVTLAMVRLGLAAAAAMLTLLDWAALGLDHGERPVWWRLAEGNGRPDDSPSCVQLLTRWPRTQDSHAHFLPSLIIIMQRLQVKK